VIFFSWERNGRASGRFGGAVSYVGELGGNQERLGQTLLLPWVFLVRPCFRLVGKLLLNPFLFLVSSLLLFVPCEELTPVLMKFALSFLFWTYFTDNSNIDQKLSQNFLNQNPILVPKELKGSN
jgi:hypothetical protein